MLDEDLRPSFADACLDHPVFGSQFRRETYKAAEVIYVCGAPITEFGIVVEGCLKANIYTIEGTEMCATYFDKDDVFPELLYFTDRKEYSYTLIADKRATIAWMPAPAFEDMLRQDEDLMYLFMLYLSKVGLKNQLLLCCMRYQTIRQRIAYWLIGMDDLAQGESMPLPASQAMWANMLRVSRSSFNQELKRMEKQGYFRIRDRRLYVLDRTGLEDLI